MLGYAARTVPWSRVLAAACLVLLLMELVGRWPQPTWALQGAAVGLLAGAAAWCLDEPAARLVDTAPRSLARRTAARSPAVGFLLVVWVVAAARSWDSLGGHGRTVLLQGVAAVAIALGWTTWRRAGGVATPGNVFAVGVVPAALVWGLSRLSEWVPVFPYVHAEPGDWTASSRGWLVAGVVGMVALVAALSGAHWRLPPGGRGAPPPAGRNAPPPAGRGATPPAGRGATKEPRDPARWAVSSPVPATESSSAVWISAVGTCSAPTEVGP
jgi:hypothetical protein